jgi:hypothetical protein
MRMSLFLAHANYFVKKKIGKAFSDILSEIRSYTMANENSITRLCENREISAAFNSPFL